MRHHTCPQCRVRFKPSQPRQRFCSARCRMRNYNTRHAEQIRAYKKTWNLLARPRKERVANACAKCGENFETSIAQQKFCSEKCRDADHYRRHKPRVTAYTKQYRKQQPEKARAQCRRYYAKHRTAENAKSRQRYAERKQKLVEAERILERLKSRKKPEGTTETEVIGSAVEARIPAFRWLAERQSSPARLKPSELEAADRASRSHGPYKDRPMIAARWLIAGEMEKEYDSVAWHHGQFRRTRRV
jgi:endogenous inhibitor of DNA gyrase (YacG/DUF329 family)